MTFLRRLVEGIPRPSTWRLARRLSLVQPQSPPRSLLLLLLLLLATTTARAGLAVHDAARFAPDVVLRVTLANITVGCEMRLSAVVNGTSPGPVVRLPPAAVSWIRVHNDMAAGGLTMHWHGLAQRLAPFSDGTPLASQWPIEPGHFFDYEIQTSASDPGTYFYHSHVGVQALSAMGPLIVNDDYSHCSGGGGGGGGPPLTYDDERVLVISDLFNRTDEAIIVGATGAGKNFSFTETHGILVNGQGVARDATAGAGPAGGMRGRYGGGYSSGGRLGLGLGLAVVGNRTSSDHATPASANVAAAESTTCSLAVVDVDPGKTYRLRFIGAAGLSFVAAALEGHDNLTVVQVDGGEYNVPVTTDHMQLGSGQRFDVLLRTKTAAELAADDRARSNQTSSNSNNSSGSYYLQIETRGRKQADRAYAVVRYRAAQPVPPPPATPPVVLPSNLTDWLEYRLSPLDADQSEAPAAADVTRRVVLAASQERLPPAAGSSEDKGRIVWKFNGLGWTEHARTTPLLVDIYTRGQAAVPNWTAALANHGWDPATQAFPARVGEVLEIIVQNTGSLVDGGGSVDVHPLHAHGQHVYDIGSGPGLYDAAANEARMQATGYRPVRRDTTMLYQYENVTKPGAPAGWRAWRVRVTNPGVWMIHCHTLVHMIMGMQTIWVVGNASDIMQLPVEESQGYFVPNGDVYGNETTAPTVFEFFGKATADVCAPQTGADPPDEDKNPFQRVWEYGASSTDT